MRCAEGEPRAKESPPIDSLQGRGGGRRLLPLPSCGDTYEGELPNPQTDSGRYVHGLPPPCQLRPPCQQTTPKTDWDMWASRSKWPTPTPSTPTPTRSPLEPGSPSSRGRRGQREAKPLPLPLPRPLLCPLPTATRTPATQCPPGQKDWRGRGRNWAGGKGRTKEGNRTGQTALAENGAERRRRRRKGKLGKNHCGC